MPVRHSPPRAGGPGAEETLKKPTRKGRKEKGDEGLLHYLEGMEPGFPTLSKAASGLEPSTETQAPLLGFILDPPAENPPSSPPTTPSTSSDTENQIGVKGTPAGGVIVVDGVEFHHESEAEFARLLTYYGIEWQYEPNSFPLRWHEGRPTEMFSPDFYLTEYDMYIELTTMRQSLVRRKNRKLRLLRALYPEINIKLLYRRDYQRLLERFGIRSDDMEAESPPEGEV
jgi:hypothetical protein